ncbi:MAG: DUF2946 family protein [Rhodomicrobium sp.]
MWRCGWGAREREAAVAFGVFVLLLNVLAGTLSHSYFHPAGGLALSQDGSKIAICSGARMVFVDRDGKIVPAAPGEPQHQHECICCLLMQASAVLPPQSPAPAPLKLSVIQTLRPSGVQHLHAAAVPTIRNRDPPLTSVA